MDRKNGIIQFLMRLLETIAIYFIISFLGISVIAGKLKNHFPPSRAEVSEVFGKMGTMLSKSEESLENIQKMAEAAASIQPNLQKIIDSSSDSQKRLDNLEFRITSLEKELHNAQIRK